MTFGPKISNTQQMLFGWSHGVCYIVSPALWVVCSSNVARLVSFFNCVYSLSFRISQP